MPIDSIPVPETKEEMTELVDQLAAERSPKVEPETVPEKPKKAEKPAKAPKAEKPDAQITAEHADNKKKPAKAEEDTADENAQIAHSDSEKTGKAKPDSAKADSKEDWREEAKAEAAAYGISDEDIADFDSREELDRALKLFDRNLDAERKKVLSEKEGEDKGGEVQEKKEPEPKAKAQDDGKYEVRLDKDIYDEELVGEFERMREHYESRLSALEEHFQGAAAAAEVDKFDRGVDALEFAQLFGTTGEESADEHARRKELFDRVKIEQTVMERLGRNVDYNALVRRVARAAFPEEYDKKLLKNHTRRISRQSDKRQGGGATRPTDPPENPRDEADRRYRELERV